MDISFLYWEECMSHEEALRRLRQVMAEEGILAPIKMRVHHDLGYTVPCTKGGTGHVTVSRSSCLY